jgi:hypothetical protein
MTLLMTGGLADALLRQAYQTSFSESKVKLPSHLEKKKNNFYSTCKNFFLMRKEIKR